VDKTADRPVDKVPRRENASGADPARQRDVERVLDSSDASLLDIVDNVLNKGVVLSGDLTIALAQVDLVYARLSLLLCAADRVRLRQGSGEASPKRNARRRVLPNEDTDLMERRHDRRQRRSARLRQGSGGQARRVSR
jgi:hypothetical protein